MRSSRASSSSLGGGLNGLNGGGGAGDIRQPLDWSSSSFGLFTGLLSLVALIINLIVYFALVNQVCTSLLHIRTYNMSTKVMLCSSLYIAAASSLRPAG